MKYTYKCSKCGKVVDLRLYATNTPIVFEMKKKKQCFDCAMWIDLLKNRASNMYIVSRGLYELGKIKKAYYVNGYDEIKNGATFLMQPNTHKVFFTDSCKFLGKIPKSMRYYRDQYKFISLDTFRKIRLFGNDKCYLKGCYDRYHCFLYDIGIEKENGPWNKVPNSHTIGDENCESFINKSNMYNV